MPLKVVEVTWLDACHQSGETTKAEILRGMTLKTVGYLVKRDKEFISIAMEVAGDTYRNVTTIPKALVKRVRNIER